MKKKQNAIEIAKDFLKRKYRDSKFLPKEDIILCINIDENVFDNDSSKTINHKKSCNTMGELDNNLCLTGDSTPWITLIDIKESTISIYKLKCNSDFSLKQESKWVVNTKKKNPTTEDIRKHIKQLLLNAKKNGQSEIELRSGDIHAELNMSNAMPTVCSAMKSLHKEIPYEITQTPPKGNGSNLYIKYTLGIINE